MYLSFLLIDVGQNPDRLRPGRLWLRNAYRVHQRLCMAFPSAPKKSDDPDFLKPFNPADFGGPYDTAPEHVHVGRESHAGFLFRIDPQAGGRVVIVVQSAAKPDWDYAFRNAGFLLAAPAQVEHFEPYFAEGQFLKFRVVANPTRKIDTKSGPDGSHRNGRRVPVRNEGLYEWLASKGEASGFSIDRNSVTVQPGYVQMSKGPDKPVRLRSARYEGILKVTDAARFQDAVVRGIGPAKALGFGLLSVAPAR